MKKNFHPENHDIQPVCACGKVHEVASTRTNLKVDICSNCHPFFTGQQKYIDRAGRIEKFRKRFDAPAGK